MLIWDILKNYGGTTEFERESGIKIDPDLYNRMLYMSFVTLLMSSNAETKTRTIVEKFVDTYNLPATDEDRELLRVVGKKLRQSNFHSDKVVLMLNRIKVLSFLPQGTW